MADRARDYSHFDVVHGGGSARRWHASPALAHDTLVGQSSGLSAFPDRRAVDGYNHLTGGVDLAT